MNDIDFIRLNLQMIQGSIKDLPVSGRVKRQALEALNELEIAVDAAELSITPTYYNSTLEAV